MVHVPKYEVFWQTLCTWRAEVEAPDLQTAKAKYPHEHNNLELVAEEDPLDGPLYGGVMIKELK